MEFNEKFWLANSFIIFIVVSLRFIRKFIITYLDSKVNEISEKARNAAAMRAEAESLLQELEQKYLLCVTNAKKNIEVSKNNIKSNIQKKKEEFEKLIVRKEEEAVKRLIILKDIALKSMYQELLVRTALYTREYIEAHKEKLPADIKIIKKFLS